MSQATIIKAIVLGASILAGSVQAQALYTIKDLSTLTPDQSYFIWSSISSKAMLGSNDVIGAVVYSKGTRRQLNLYATGHSNINNRGDITFNELLPDYSTGRGLYIGQNGVVTEIPRLFPNAKYEILMPSHLNDLGAAVGTSVRSPCNQDDTACTATEPVTRAFKYAEGTITDLGTLGGYSSTANGINNLGMVVGASTRAGEGLDRPFLSVNGQMQELAVPGLINASAKAINDAGQIVGTGWDAENNDTAFLYDHGKVTLLKEPGMERTSATGINRHGVVIGGGSGNAWMYTNGKMVYLADLLAEPGWQIWSVYDINDQGAILAEASRPDGTFVSALLSPVQKQAKAQP